MNFSRHSLRGAEIWPIWKQHHHIDCLWKTLKSIFHIREMRLHGDGIYTALLLKVVAYLLAIRLEVQRAYSTFTITQVMRKREHYTIPLLNYGINGLQNIRITCERFDMVRRIVFDNICHVVF